ncbi:VWA domain-containing protein [Endozoicomonas sp. SM1973]|uniref:VWA domain-containing protein n=1 Tax=Spartinivicinus marinus TaxID=2994442 RepID=A0A853I5X9_9GAMM|nr:VWA domain-containing protein [Spartinivicinus marinus]MCX4027026.1 VWA domain-containing protein [Spartinivicinus marinus]NYZ67022.1 VWA domain-containing protein [Spartinivicinus marinus]
MKVSHFKQLAIGVVSSFMLVVSVASAKVNPVNLSVDLATPVLEADKAQKAFVKISLTGIKQNKDIAKRTPTNIAIVLDKSGSMQGNKIRHAREAAIMAINQLGRDDIVSVVTYDTTVSVVVPATKVTNKANIANMIRQVQANGSTALFAGVSKGADEIRKFISANRVNRVILLSDGLANVGPQSPSELGQLGASLAKEGISVTTIGLGLGYNEDLMTQLAGFSDGNHAFVENAQDLAKIFQSEFGDVLSVIAQGVNIEIHCTNGVRPIRILGREGEVIGNKVRTRLNQLYSTQEKYLILEVEVPPGKSGQQKDIASVQVSYNNMLNKKQEALSGLAVASFSKSKQEVTKSINKDVYEDSVEQVANEATQQAIRLRDEGNIPAAKAALKQSADYLAEESKVVKSEKLKKQQEEVLEDAAALESEADWNKNRKLLKEKQYKRAKQQSY